MSTGAGPRRPPPGSTIGELIETQRLGCELAGSPLYAAVLDAVAGDVAAGGECSSVLAPHQEAPFGDAVLLRLLAVVHRLVLRGDAPGLAAHYPSVGGRPGPQVGAAFLSEVAAHRREVADGMTVGVQTNEVGRSASLLAGFVELGRLGLPLRLLEVGASAGLNLWFDRYRYEAGPPDGRRGFGPPESPVRFVDPWAGPAPDLDGSLEVAERAGCDLSPIDPTTAPGRLLLRSYVWPDQVDRRARLDAALDAVADRPPSVERARAADWLGRRLARPARGLTTVVFHSIVFQYLPPAERRAVVAAIDDAGRRATRAAPLAWLRMEPGGDQAEVRLTTWPGGQDRVVARSSFHGPPVVLSAPQDPGAVAR